MSKAADKFSPELRVCAARYGGGIMKPGLHRRAAKMSIAAKIGCPAQTLNGWVKKAEVDSGREPELTIGMAGQARVGARELGRAAGQ